MTGIGGSVTSGGSEQPRREENTLTQEGISFKAEDIVLGKVLEDCKFSFRNETTGKNYTLRIGKNTPLYADLSSLQGDSAALEKTKDLLLHKAQVMLKIQGVANEALKIDAKRISMGFNKEERTVTHVKAGETDLSEIEVRADSGKNQRIQGYANEQFSFSKTQEIFSKTIEGPPPSPTSPGPVGNGGRGAEGPAIVDPTGLSPQAEAKLDTPPTSPTATPVSSLRSLTSGSSSTRSDLSSPRPGPSEPPSYKRKKVELPETQRRAQLAPLTIQGATSGVQSTFSDLVEKATQVPKMETKLFAAIHLNSYAKGTDYEGGQAIQSMKLIQSLSPIIYGKRHAISKEHSRIGIKYKQYNDLKKKGTLQKKGTVQELCETVSKDIKELRPGERLLVPGGWAGSGDKPGHVMLYEIKKTNGKYSFTIYNSGAGLQYHASSGDKVQLFKRYENLSFENVSKAGLFRDLFWLQTSQDSFSEGNSALIKSADTVYHRIHSEFRGKEAKLDNPEFKSPQKSGTCFWNAFKAWTSDKEYSRKVKYLTLKSFFESKRGSLSQDFETQALLQTAAERFLEQEKIYLKRLASKGEATQSHLDDLNQCTDLVKEIKDAIESSREELRTKRSNQTFKFGQGVDNGLEEIYESKVEPHHSEFDLSRSRINEEPVHFEECRNANDLADKFESIREKIDTCVTWNTEKNEVEKKKSDEEITSIFRDFLETIPLPTDEKFWGALDENSESAKKLAENLLDFLS